MTLLEKILRRQHSTIKYSSPSFKSYLSSSRNHEGRFVLEKQDVRLVIFKDHDQFGRKLLYDSHRCEGKESNDKQLLGELMFGNQVMVKKVTSTIKVHILKDPPQFLIAKVFIPSTSTSSEYDCQRSCGVFDWYCFHDLPQNDLLASSTSLPVPLRDDLNKSYDASNVGSEPSYKASLTKWWTLRNTDDSPEMGLTCSLAVPNTAYKVRVHQNIQGHSLTDSTQSLPLNQRPVKLGIGILFQIPENDFAAEFMRKFFFSHVNILESFILKLKDVLQSVEFLNKFKKCRTEHVHNFFQESTEGIIQSLLNFYSFPRIQNPVWLTLSLPSTSSSSSLPSSSLSSSSSSSSSSLVGFSFVKEFVFLSDKCYTRNTKFFLGSLLTAVLTHHLSWVSSSSVQSPLSQFHSSTSPPSINPLLSQLRDLYGAVGFPCCISKTVVVGKRIDLVKRFLFILSYFIRCNDLLETSEHDDDADSRAADSYISKDSGFSESEAEDAARLSREKLKKLESLFQHTNFSETFTMNTFCSTDASRRCDLMVNHQRRVDDDEESRESISTQNDESSHTQYHSGSNITLVTHKDHSNDGDFQSIFPFPNGFVSKYVDDTSYQPRSDISIQNVTMQCHTPEISSFQKEESQLQKTTPTLHFSSTKQTNIFNGFKISNELKFDLEESLYEIMEEIYGDQSTTDCSSSYDRHFFDSSSLESTLENHSDQNSCLLDVNEPTCLPDGPIRDQLLFKLGLIGTAIASEALLEPEIMTFDSNLRALKKLTEVPLLNIGDVDEEKLLPEDSNLGRSILGGFCRSFTPEFVLHGTSDRSFLSPPYHILHQDLKTSLKSPILSEPADAALYIVADTDTWSVQLFSLKSLSPDEPPLPQTIISSQLVLRLIESTFELSKFNSSPHIWLSLVEDQLNNIYMKSKVLAEFIQIHGQFCSQQLARLLGYDVSDLPLLLAVAGIHSPRILSSLINPQINF